MEWHATRLRIAVTVHPPGLLQTGDHARAVFAAVIPACPRTTSTSPAVARRQSVHLLRISDSENVNLRVIPFKAGKADHLLQG